jgi:polyhydroxyalkanoate synthesis regulator phasin
MASNDGFRKYVEAGAALGQITRARAEEIVRELVGAGQLQGTQAQEWVDDLVERSRKASEDLLDLVRTEVASQLTALGIDPEDLAKQAADLLRHSADVGRRATQTAAAQASAAARAAKKSRPAKRSSAAKAATGSKKPATKKKATTSKKATTAKKKATTAKKAGPGTKKAAAKKSTAGPAADR